MTVWELPLFSGNFPKFRLLLFVVSMRVYMMPTLMSSIVITLDKYFMKEKSSILCAQTFGQGIASNDWTNVCLGRYKQFPTDITNQNKNVRIPIVFHRIKTNWYETIYLGSSAPLYLQVALIFLDYSGDKKYFDLQNLWLATSVMVGRWW